MNAADLTFLRVLAEEAIGSGPRKWHANQQLLTWFRSDPVAVIRALEAAAHVSARPGGVNHQALHTSIRQLPPVERAS